MTTALKTYRILIVLIIAGLIASGVTAFPLQTELNLLAKLSAGDPANWNPAMRTGWAHWILKVREGLERTYADYPFIAYGTDWLAFGHIVIALFFILPFRDPLRYSGVLRVGLAACLLIVPLALACGTARGIPFFWQLIDMSFGLGCSIPLLLAIRLEKKLGQEQAGGAP